MTTDRPKSWTHTYPLLQQLLNDTIQASRTNTDIPALRQVRRDLAQIDQGHQPYPQGQPGWNPHAAFRLIRQVIAAAPLGHPVVGAVLRLAADIADQNTAARAAATPGAAS